MTFGDIKTRIEQIVNATISQTYYVRFSPDDYKTAINNAQYKLIDLGVKYRDVIFKVHGVDIFSKLWNSKSTVGTFNLEDENAYTVLAVVQVAGTYRARTGLRYVPETEFEKLSASLNSFKKPLKGDKIWTIKGNAVHISPDPISEDESYTFYYIKHPTLYDGTNDIDSPDFPRSIQNVIPYLAAYELAIRSESGLEEYAEAWYKQAMDMLGIGGIVNANKD